MDRKLLARVVAFSLAVMMVLMLVLAPVLARAEYQKVTPQEVCDSIFRIASMDGAGAVTPLGTGFAIGAAAPVSYVVTSNHVVENHADSLVVWMNLDHYVRATVVISLSQADLAVLKLETGINKPPLPLSLADQVTQADAVYAYGFPDYDIHDFNMAYPSDVTVTSGTLSKKTTLNNIGYYQFDASINTGNSGGPLWHADSGGVIGVVAVKSAVSDGINGAVCTEVLIEALDLQNIPYLLSSDLAAVSGPVSGGAKPLLIVGIVMAGAAIVLLVIALVLRVRAARETQDEPACEMQPYEPAAAGDQGVRIADEQSLSAQVDEVPDDTQSRMRRRATFSHDPSVLKPIALEPETPQQDAAQAFVSFDQPQRSAAEPDDAVTVPVAPDPKTRLAPKRAQRPVVRAVEGFFQGGVVPVGRTLLIGRDSARCQLVYPLEMTRISRVHVKIVYDETEKQFTVTDLSTNGVFLQDGTRLPKGVGMPFPAGTRLMLSNSEELIELAVENA